MWPLDNKKARPTDKPAENDAALSIVDLPAKIHYASPKYILSLLTDRWQSCFMSADWRL